MLDIRTRFIKINFNLQAYYIQIGDYKYNIVSTL
jgi:hypothetical protein